MKKILSSACLVVIAAAAAAFSAAAESVIPQGTNVAPNGDRLEVTSKCLRLNGRALIPVMGEMHYSRVPRAGRAHRSERRRGRKLRGGARDFWGRGRR